MDLEKILTQGSPLLVLVVVVYFLVDKFLAHMSKEADSQRSMFKEMHAEHILARKETKDSVDANTKAMNENTQAVSHLALKVEGIK